MHTHPAGWYYVTMGGKMKVTHADGKSEMWEPPTGESAWMEAEVESAAPKRAGASSK